MHIDTEQLLDLVDGDISPEEARSCLDHLDGCPECAATFNLIVDLKAHRHEALGVLTVADAAPEQDARIVPIPHPAAIVSPSVSSSWASRGLRMAASLALVGLLGVLLWSAPIVPLNGTSEDVQMRQTLAAMATDEFRQVIHSQPRDEDIRLTSDSAETTTVETALGHLENDRHEMAIALLSPIAERDPDDETIRLYLGIAQYLAGDAAAAAGTLRPLEDASSYYVWRTALWYEANALLRLGRASEAKLLIHRLAHPDPDDEPAVGNVFQPEARRLEARLAELLQGD